MDNASANPGDGERRRPMFLAGSTEQWWWSEDTFPPLGFCVRALVHDGLAVPPFDQHPEGDGSLREAGLNATMWREWLGSVLRQRTLLSAVSANIDGGVDQKELVTAARAAGEVLTSPGSFCPGSPELGRRLDELWVQYQPLGDVWKERMTSGEEGVRHRHRGRWLWNALLPFHDRLPTISVLLVAYPVPVVLALPPTTCLIAPAQGPDAYGRQVVEAANQLSTAA
jgi:hypothetical protein